MVTSEIALAVVCFTAKLLVTALYSLLALVQGLLRYHVVYLIVVYADATAIVHLLNYRKLRTSLALVGLPMHIASSLAYAEQSF